MEEFNINGCSPKVSFTLLCLLKHGIMNSLIIYIQINAYFMYEHKMPAQIINYFIKACHRVFSAFRSSWTENRMYSSLHNSNWSGDTFQPANWNSVPLIHQISQGWYSPKGSLLFYFLSGRAAIYPKILSKCGREASKSRSATSKSCVPNNIVIKQKCRLVTKRLQGACMHEHCTVCIQQC